MHPLGTPASRDELLIELGRLLAEAEGINAQIANLRDEIARHDTGRRTKSAAEDAQNPIHRDPDARDNAIIGVGQVVRLEDLPTGFRYITEPLKSADEDLAAAVADTLADGPEMRPLAHHMQPDGEPVAGTPPAPSDDALAAAGLSAQEIKLIRAKRRGEQLQATPIDPTAPVKPYDVSEPYHGDREQQAQIEQQRRAAQNATAGTPRVSPINSGGVNGQLATRWKDKPAENGIRTRG